MVILSIVILVCILVVISYHLGRRDESEYYKKILNDISYELQGVNGIMPHDNIRINNARKIIICTLHQEL